MAAKTPTLPYIGETYRSEATQNGLSDEQIALLATYAEKLEGNRVPVIFDSGHFSKLVGYDQNLLFAITNDPRKFYRTFRVPKRNGDFRRIDEPLPTLKEIQRFILDTIVQKVKISKAAKAFRRNSSIKGNARLHLRQPEILKLDIENFFPSVRFTKIYSIFFELGYTKQLSVLLAKLCCFNDGLPQGAPTSPALANIVLREVDEMLLNISIEGGLRYTRYADDLVFSGVKVPSNTLSKVRKIIKKAGFKLNDQKIRLLRDGSRKVVTGIVVNEIMQATRSVRRDFRQAVYFIRKFGFDGYVQHSKEPRAKSLDHLIGIGGFIVWVNKADAKAKENLEYLKRLKHEYLKLSGDK